MSQLEFKMDDVSPSETGYDSLISASPSLLDLITTERGGCQFSAIAEWYSLPFNEQTKTCESLNHEFSKVMNGGDLYYEPELEAGYIAQLLKDGGCVLDLGCGVEGLWCQSMAVRFPKTEVIGVDLIGVELKLAPPNVSFQICNLENGLPFPDTSFDLIHIRFTSPWIDLLELHPSIRRILKPNGIFLIEEAKCELTKADGSLAVQSWFNATKDPWTATFDRLAYVCETPVRASTEGSFDGGTGEMMVEGFEQVEKREGRLHLGWRTYLPAHLMVQKASKLLRESLIGYFRLPFIGFDGEVAQKDRLLKLAAMFPEKDSGLWEAFVFVWARKKGPGRAEGAGPVE